MEPSPNSTWEGAGPGIHTGTGGTSWAVKAVTSSGFTSAENKNWVGVV